MCSNIQGIEGVLLQSCRSFPDERGSFTEVFRSSWVPECGYGKSVQLNLSRSVRGALRGLHYHNVQNDWWIPVSGELQLALADLRKGSPTYMKVVHSKLSAKDSACILIPPGVAHGFLALSELTLVYAVDRYYDGSDEQGVAWNDPSLNVPWIIPSPVLSKRDRTNPTVRILSERDRLPFYSSQS